MLAVLVDEAKGRLVDGIRGKAVPPSHVLFAILGSMDLGHFR